MIGPQDLNLQKRENHKKILFFFNGDAWSGMKRIQVLEKNYTSWGPGDRKMENKIACDLRVN